MNPVTCICSEVVVKSDRGISKIRSKVVLVRQNQVFAVCKSCGMEVQIPLAPTESSSPNLELSANPAGPPLLLRK